MTSVRTKQHAQISLNTTCCSLHYFRFRCFYSWNKLRLGVEFETPGELGELNLSRFRSPVNLCLIYWVSEKLDMIHDLIICFIFVHRIWRNLFSSFVCQTQKEKSQWDVCVCFCLRVYHVYISLWGPKLKIILYLWGPSAPMGTKCSSPRVWSSKCRFSVRVTVS